MGYLTNDFSLSTCYNYDNGKKLFMYIIKR